MLVVKELYLPGVAFSPVLGFSFFFSVMSSSDIVVEVSQPKAPLEICKSVL